MRERGITLVELLVVMVLIAIISGIVGPPVANRLENLSLQTTASQLVAAFRKAQAEARVSQTPVAATYSAHQFHFLKGTKEIGTFSLPVSISPSFESGSDTSIFLPSGQIAGLDHLQLLNRNGRKAVIGLGFISGIAVVQDSQ